jgi:hypothetical protein
MDDYTRTRDLRPVCGNRTLCIGPAGLSLRRQREGSHYDRKEQRTPRAEHAEDSNGRPISRVSNGVRGFFRRHLNHFTAQSTGGTPALSDVYALEKLWGAAAPADPLKRCI